MAVATSIQQFCHKLKRTLSNKQDFTEPNFKVQFKGHIKLCAGSGSVCSWYSPLLGDQIFNTEI